MESKYKKLIKNLGWILLGNTGSKVISFLLLPFYTRWLGTNGYGVSDLITTYASFLVGFMTLCVSDAIFIFTKNKDRIVQKKYFSSVLNFALMFLSIWFVLFGLISSGTSYWGIYNTFTQNLWYIYLIVLTTFLQNYTQQFTISISKMKVYSFSGMVLCSLTFVFSYIFIPTYGVYGYITATIGANLITSVYSFVFSKSFSYYSLKEIDLSKVKEVIRYSVPLIPNVIIWWLVSAFNRPVMETYLDYSMIGLYAIANRFPAIITMVFGLFSVSWNISVFEEYGKPSFEQFYLKIFRAVFLVLICISLILILFSKQILYMFVSPEFFGASTCMVLLFVSSVLSCISGFFGSSFAVVKKSKYYFYSSIWGVLVSLTLNVPLIKYWGINGAALNVILSFLVMVVSRYIYSLNYVKVSLTKELILYILVLGVETLTVLLSDNLFLKFFVTIVTLFILFIFERNSIKTLIHFMYNRK